MGFETTCAEHPDHGYTAVSFLICTELAMEALHVLGQESLSVRNSRILWQLNQSAPALLLVKGSLTGLVPAVDAAQPPGPELTSAQETGGAQQPGLDPTAPCWAYWDGQQQQVCTQTKADSCVSAWHDAKHAESFIHVVLGV